jgi:tetratricopeptide (TPR) repeat protein
LAKAEFQTAIRLDPSSVKAYSNLGITMEALGDGAEALNSYTHALDLNEKQPHPSEWPYIYLAAYYNRQKNAAQALAFARKAADLNPHADAAYFELAKAYRTQKELQQSAAAARRAIAVNAQIPDYYYVLGLVLRELGNQKESADALAKYAQLQQPAADASDHTVQEPLNAPEPQ